MLEFLKVIFVGFMIGNLVAISLIVPTYLMFSFTILEWVEINWELVRFVFCFCWFVVTMLTVIAAYLGEEQDK